jgi:redox-sensitive bicupin YhaK (pirin superfamily)
LRHSIYSPSLQAIGAFDGGKITEQKPIGFPGEGSAVKRVGPLFYWAWAKSNQAGHIPSHPHSAFEIMTYVVTGQAEHGDSLGTRSVVGPGGAQVMQTGSGVYHEERFIGPQMEGFQIWFEPHLEVTFKQPPTYHQYDHKDFPLVEGDGFLCKTVIGEGAPVQLVADARMWDVTVKSGGTYVHPVEQGRVLAALAIRGGGTWSNSHDVAAKQAEKDFAVLYADETAEWKLQADTATDLRIIVIDVPETVDYPLYPKR